MASTKLTRTPSSAGNRKTWTFSTWFKRSNISSGQKIFSAQGDGSNVFESYFNTNDTLAFYHFSSSGAVTDSFLGTNQVFRDTSAWYHLVFSVDTTQATASNRVKMYVNGEQVTSFSTAIYFNQNYDTYINWIYENRIGANLNNAVSQFFDGSMAHVHLIDGTAYDASAFGETDSLTGIWKPKTAPSVTYGTNGFFLKFENSAAFGTDSSGNANTFTVNGTMTQNIDTPSNVFATMNPLNNLSTSGSGTLTKGNLEVSYSGGLFNTNATISVSTGKWYWETKGVSNMQQGSVGARIGFLNQDNTGYANPSFDGGCIFGMYWHPTNGIYTDVSGTQTLRSSTLTYTDGDIIGIALDLTNNISYWYKNGSLSFTYDFSALTTIGSSYICPALGNASGTSNPVFQANFGNGYFGTTAVSSAQNPDDGIGIFEYDVPTGYYALNTKAINAQEYD